MAGHAAEQLLGDALGKDAYAVGAARRDVGEVHGAKVGPLLRQPRADEGQVVVLHENRGAFRGLVDHRSGEGVELNMLEAKDWYEKAAAQGDAEAVIVTVPFLLPCAIPDARTEAKLGLDDFHETPLRLVATLPSLNVPVAVNLIDVPFSMRGFAGETAIETR